MGLFRDKQHAINRLNRWYAKLYYSLGYGGHFGWDWPTIRAVNPACYNSLKRINDMAKPYRDK